MPDKKTCMDEALRRLSYRLYSCNELRIHLAKKDFGENEIQQAINTLIEKDYLNDEKFVEGFVTGRAARRLMSMMGVVYELKRVVGNVPWLEEKVSEIYNEFLGGEEKVISKLARKRLNGKHYSGLEKKEKRKLVNYLTNKGFKYYLVEKVLDNLSE